MSVSEWHMPVWRSQAFYRRGQKIHFIENTNFFFYSYLSLPWNFGACGSHLAVIHPWPWAPSTCTILTRIKEMRCTEIDCNNTKSETSSHRKEIPGSDRQHPTSSQFSLDPVAQMSLLGWQTAAVLGDVLHTMCTTDLGFFFDPMHEDF